MKCERHVDDKPCPRPAVAFVQGQHVCAAHEPPLSGRGTCSHSLAPSGRCAYCGAAVEAVS